MPYCARYLAAVWVNPRTANFVAEHNPIPGLPIWPAWDAALMILPPRPSLLNAFVAAWMPHTTPLKLIEKSFRYSPW
jgi:hypothetical protein